jgi:LPXTG-site transpeptidase (sortase) family protein
MSGLATSYNDDILRSRLLVRRQFDEPTRRSYDRDFRRPIVRPPTPQLKPHTTPSTATASNVVVTEEDDTPLQFINLAFAPEEQGPARTAQQPFYVRNARKGYVVQAMALLLFAIGAFVSIQGFLLNKNIAEQSGAVASAASPAVETPIEPDQLSAYQVSPDMPRYIRVTSLGVEARVLQVGTDDNGAVATPNNVHDAAWYRGSSLPGQSGAGLIVGHVAGPSQPGVFTAIGTLSPGDQFEVEMGNGKRLTYAVQQTATYSKDDVDMPRALSVTGEARSGLNLITCHGTFDATTQQYSERLVVFATLIK